MSEFYTTYHQDKVSKIGNTIAYLGEKLGSLSKTKILKLLYILDELSIKKSGLPLLNLKYKVWKFGPVAEDLFIDFSTAPTILKDYINRKEEDGHLVITAKNKFNDDEFSQNDLDLMEYVTTEFGSRTTQELIRYTHRVNSPWYKTAKENSVLDLLEKGEISHTEFVIDMGKLVSHSPRKHEIYLDYLTYQ